MQLGVSVIICCYNSSRRLPDTLKHLFLQKVPENISWEIIIVDNLSTDDTRAAAETVEKNHNLNKISFKIIDQPNAGKNYAFEKGAEAARYEYLLTCDDDNWLDEDYVCLAFQIMQGNPNAGAAGGISIATTDGTIPEWFSQYQFAYAVGKQADSTGMLFDKKYIWGAGMIIRNSVFKKVFANYTSIMSCRKGTSLSSGGDAEITMRIILAGYGLYYDERLKLTHFIPHERLTHVYRDRLFKGFDDTDNVLGAYESLITIHQANFRKRAALLFFSFIRLFISTVLPVRRWDRNHEARTIFLITNLSLLPITDYVREVKNVYIAIRRTK
jgi:glycosyltransferase involved in cell wall biosynthesis